jgi:exodeoxyribonuclease VII small subunit
MAKISKQTQPSYQALSAELNETLAALQQDDVDIDSALKYYQRGLILIEQLKKYLETAENNVEQLHAKYSGSS